MSQTKVVHFATTLIIKMDHPSFSKGTTPIGNRPVPPRRHENIIRTRIKSRRLPLSRPARLYLDFDPRPCYIVARLPLAKDAAAGVPAAAERDAVPAGGPTQPAPGRLRQNARPALRPVCDCVAGLGQAETGNARLSAASQEERWS
jgi:hypothetical protein